MRAKLSLNMTKLLALLLVLMPILLAVEAQSGKLHHQRPRMMRRRIEPRSVASWLTKISSKASDWVFGSVPNPVTDPKNIPKPQVGGVAVLPQMLYPYATGMVPRLASETLSGNGLPGGWMCMHITPPAEEDDDAGGLGGGLGGGAGLGAGGMGGEEWVLAEWAGEEWVLAEWAGEEWVLAEWAGEEWVLAEWAGRGGMGGGGMGTGGMGGGGMGTGGMGVGGGLAGGQQNGAAGGFAGGAGTGFGVGAGAGYAGAGGQQGFGAGGQQGFGAGGQQGFGAGVGGGMGTGGLGVGAGAGTGSAAVPAGYIRYNGQLMTIGQYQQALAASSGTPSSLSRRDVYQSDTSAFLNTFMHKRQSSDAPAPQPADDGDAAPKKKPAKVLMCINGDPDVPPIKFDTMTGLRIRDPQAQKDGVVEITNLPNYQMPWMAFLPTVDMWNEQQALMIAQEKVIEINMTTAPPPAR
ncbi:uncharacterized protein SPSC_05474 [Sporisorium scitamineum]|uniref:Uncharacterized protein n=3 Tax=Sporisorium scitamineum TaxID=49012 RepID=A0A127ZHH3_9BASI|nr:uncharacterized protein SPSC_05474 [Sporisorium scitamineum]